MVEIGDSYKLSCGHQGVVVSKIGNRIAVKGIGHAYKMNYPCETCFARKNSGKNRAYVRLVYIYKIDEPVVAVVK